MKTLSRSTALLTLALSAGVLKPSKALAWAYPPMNPCGISVRNFWGSCKTESSDASESEKGLFPIKRAEGDSRENAFADAQAKGWMDVELYAVAKQRPKDEGELLDSLRSYNRTAKVLIFDNVGIKNSPAISDELKALDADGVSVIFLDYPDSSSREIDSDQ